MTMLRGILVGASRRGQYLGHLLRQTGDAEVVACVDPIVAKAAYLAETQGWTACRVFPTIEEALAATPCEGVVVASSDAHHAEGVIPALRAGKFVFSEKPLDTTWEKCRAIIDADRAAGGKTFIGLNLRYAPLYATLHRLIAEGAIGRVLTIEADEFYNGGRTYFRRWNRLREEGGGLWITKATHDFDLLGWLAGAMPRDIYAMGTRSHYRPRPDAPTRCRDCALDCHDRAGAPDQLALLTEEATGAPHDLCLYNSDGDTFDHGIATVAFENDVYATYTCNVVSGFTDRRMRVSGTHGTLDGALSRDTVTLYRRDPNGVEEVPLAQGDGGHGGADGALMREFIRFIRGEGEPRCRPEEAALSVRVGLAATRACDEGRVVRWEDV